MSNTNEVEEFRVSATFDKSNFDRNIKESMGVIDSFMEKLKFKGATDGFDEVTKRARAFRLDGIEKAVTRAGESFINFGNLVRFKVLDKIANTAVSTGTRLVKSLSVDQVAAGWAKLNQKTESVQGIMNATGKTIDEVNGYLNQLMWFSDETSYGFTDMTSALNQLTSSGADIETIIPFITGIANATAYAGKGVSEFSRSIYNLTQSYGSGHLQLMDWKSLELAGTASAALKEALIEAGVNNNKIKEGQITIENFRESLSQGWADTKVMEEGFGKFSQLSEEVYRVMQESPGKFATATEAMEAIGKDGIDPLADKAFHAAQEAKSLKDALEATKDAVSSGWMQTFEGLFGDYTEAKQLWTVMANEFWEIFNGGAEARTSVLTDILDSGWNKLQETIVATGYTQEQFEESLSKTFAANHLDIQETIDRFGSLTAAVNKGAIGIGFIKDALIRTATAETSVEKNTENLKAKIDSIIAAGYAENRSLDMANLVEEGWNVNLIMGLLDKKLAGQEIAWDDITESQMECKYTLQKQEEILGKFAHKAEIAGENFDDILNSFRGMSGRQKLLESLSNILGHISMVTGAIREGFQEVFGDDIRAMIKKIIGGVTDFGNGLDNSEDKAERIKNVSKAVFEVVRDIFKVLSPVAKLAGKLISLLTKAGKAVFPPVVSLLSRITNNLHDVAENGFDIKSSLSGVTSFIGGYLDKATSWISGNDNVSRSLNDASNAIASFKKGTLSFSGIISKIGEFAKSLGKAFTDKIVETIKDAPDKIKAACTEAIGNVIDHFSKNGSVDRSLPVAMAEATIGDTGSFADTFTGTIFEKLNKVKELWNKYTENFDFGNMFAGGISLYVLNIVKNLSEKYGLLGKAVEAISVSLKSVADGFAEVGKALENIAVSIGNMFTNLNLTLKNLNKEIKAQAFKTMCDGLLKLAYAIGILVASFFVLNKLMSFNDNQVWAPLAVIAVITVLVGALVKVSADIMTAAAVSPQAVGGLALLGFLFVAIGAVLDSLIIIAALASLIPVSGIIKMMFVVATAAGALIVIVGMLSTLVETASAKDIAAASVLILLIGNTMMKLAIVAGILALIPEDAFSRAVFGMAGLALIVATLATIMTKYRGYATGMGKTLSGIATAFIILSIAMKIISGLGWGELAVGIFGMWLLANLVDAMIKVVNRYRNAAKIGWTLLAISASFILLSIAVKLLAEIPFWMLTKSAVYIVLFGFVMTLLLETIEPLAGKVVKIGGTILAISVAINLLIGAVFLLGIIPWSIMLRGIVGLIGVCGAMAILVASLRAIAGKGDISKVALNIAAMAIGVGILAVALIILGFMNFKVIAKGIIAVTALCLDMTIMVKALAKVGADARSASTAITRIIILVAVLAVLMIALSSIKDTNKLWAATVAFSAIAGVIALLMYTASLAGKSGGSAKAVGIVMALVVGAAAVLYLLNELGVDGENAIKNAIALGTVLMALSLSLAIMSLIKEDLTPNVAAFGLLLVVLTVTGIILKFLGDLDIKNAMPNALALSALILSLSVAMGFLAVAGETGFVAPLAGVVGLLALIAGLTLLVAGIGALTNWLSGGDLSAFDTGMAVLVKIGAGLGQAIAAFLEGIGDSLLDLLNKLMDNLLIFGDKFMDFAAKVGGLKKEILDGVTTMCAALLLITASELVSGLLSLLGSKIDYKSLGDQMSEFAGAAVAFTRRILNSGINPEDMARAAEIGKTFAEMAGGLPHEGGIVSWFKGNAVDMEHFATGIRSYADAIVAFCNTISNGSVSAPIVRKGVDCGEMIFTMANKAPKEGGLLQKIMGGTAMDKTASGIKKLADAFVAFGASCININEYAVEKGVTSGTKIFDMANQIPNQGGLLGKIIGDNDMESVATGIGNFAKGIKEFADQAATVNPERVEALAGAGLKVAEMLNAMPKEGGLWSKLSGSNGKVPEDFAFSLKSFAKGIIGFENEIGDHTVSAYRVQMAGTAGVYLANMIKDFPDTLPGDHVINTFCHEILSLGNALLMYEEKISDLDIDRIKESTAAVDTLRDGLGGAGNGISDLASKFNLGGIANSINEGLPDVQNAMDNLKGVFSSEDTGAKEAGSDAGYQYAVGIKTSLKRQENVIIIALSNVFDHMRDSARSRVGEYKKIGEAIPEGVRDGILVKKHIVNNAVITMISEAYDSGRKEAQVNSPSKLFKHGLGYAIPEGAADGVKERTYLFSDAAKMMVEKGYKETNHAMNTLKLFALEDFDIQPRIRPVLDLSGVRGGASAINKMFGRTSVLATTVGQIKSKTYSMNEGNDGIIRAINGLGSSVYNDNTVTINGITYSGDSEIGQAVSELARAIKVTRRS